MWRIRLVLRRLKNLLRWLPVIWRDEQWDHYFIYEVLKHKLIIMSKTIRERDNHTLAEYDADRMMLCVRLIEKVQSEFYLTELINLEEINKDMIDTAEAQHNKARRILFKLLNQYIERWWD